MADISGAELTLRTTPTAGVSGEHSPYYRRLLSSGYKGYLQGTVGGATFYGLIGLAIGVAIAVPLMLGAAAPFVAPAVAAGIAGSAWALIPITAAIGVMKGAHTFGEIGSIAAISAESAEISERRRYLLDRYYALPNDRAYDAEAEQIQKMLTTIHETPPPAHMFHWKTVALCALLGAAICASIALLPATAPIVSAFLQHTILGELVSGLPSGLAAVSGAIGVAAGTLAGAVIGLDRHYVRAWFDHTESFVNDPHGTRAELTAREMELQKLESVSPDRNRNMQTIKLEVRGPDKTAAAAAPAETAAMQPSSIVTSPELQARLVGSGIARSAI